MTTSRNSIALVGAGPRGASLLERFAAHLSVVPEPLPLTIHVIDDKEPGAGSVWCTAQTRELCMNTLSDAVTLFTEPSSTVSGPVAPGPTLYEWSLLALADIGAGDADAEPIPVELAERIRAIPEARRAPYRDTPARPGFAESFRDELLKTAPESHPSRALYGEYLRWCYDRALHLLPSNASVIHHRSRAVALERKGGREHVTLANGSTITAHSVILSTGWLPRNSTTAESCLAEQLASRPELTWVRPGSPIEQDLSGVAAATDVIIRGLGMGFFDTMALLTIGRGGRFEHDAAAAGGLRYVPSGAEPRMHVTSRRGVPFRAKSLYRSLPPRAEQRYLRAVDWANVPRPINFDQQFWPRIVADAMFDYVDTLVRLRPHAVTDAAAMFEVIESTLDALLAHPAAMAIADIPLAFEAALKPFFSHEADQFLLSSELDPAAPRPTSHSSTGVTPPDGRGTADDVETADIATYQRWVRARIADDLAESALGRDSALKAGLWSISSARGFASRVGSFGGFDAESRISGFAELFAVGGMVGSGPPSFRNAQLLALVDAGFVRFIGPNAEITVTREGFTAESPTVRGSRVSAPALIDAWMHATDISATTDPLTRSLVASGRARAFVVASRGGGHEAAFTTRSFDIDADTGLLIGASGDRDPAVHAVGIPVDDTVHDTIISPMPGTDPTMLRETDRVAASALRIVATANAERTCTQPRSASHKGVT